MKKYTLVLVKLLFVIRYYDGSKGKAVVGTISGTSISFGSPVTYSTNQIGQPSIVYRNLGKIVISYRDYTNSNRGKLL